MTSDFKCAAFTAELVFASALFCFVFFIYCGVSVQLHRENELVNLHPHHVCCRQHIIGISFSKSVHIHVRRRGSTRAHPQRQWSAGCNEAALSFTHTHTGSAFWLQYSGAFASLPLCVWYSVLLFGATHALTLSRGLCGFFFVSCSYAVGRRWAKEKLSFIVMYLR